MAASLLWQTGRPIPRDQPSRKRVTIPTCQAQSPPEEEVAVGLLKNLGSGAHHGDKGAFLK
jgi:hypothetical protein